MPYTLSMALLWVVLAVLLGIVIGWLMRSVVAKRQIERARSNHLDTVELERLRGRIANLEPAVAERDRLRSELEARRAATTPAVQGFAAVPSPVDDEIDARSDAAPVIADAVEEAHDDIEPSGASGETGGSSLDLAAAAAVLGRKLRLDDLTAVEGIGPKISDLCQGIGIQTWADLAQTEASLLRTMLHDAGPRFRTHDPATWPEQAALLAAGRWEDFRDLTARLDGGRAVD